MVEGEEIDLVGVGAKTGNKVVDRVDRSFPRTRLGLAVVTTMVLVEEGMTVGKLLKDYRPDRDQDGKAKARDCLVVHDQDDSRLCSSYDLFERSVLLHFGHYGMVGLMMGGTLACLEFNW
jgi:hypothetical protein